MTLFAVAVAAVATAILFHLSLSLRRLAAAQESIAAAQSQAAQPQVAPSRKEPLLATHTHGASTGYTVWVYKQGDWSLEEDRCADGFLPGPAPAVAGRFEGQRIRQHGISVAS